MVFGGGCLKKRYRAADTCIVKLSVKSPVDRFGQRVLILAIQRWVMFGDFLHLETMFEVRAVARNLEFEAILESITWPIKTGYQAS